MNNLFFDLPENLQMKIIRMNPHPLHKIVKDAFDEEIDFYNSHYYYDGYSYHDETDLYFKNYKCAKLWYNATLTRKMLGFTPDYVKMLLRDKYDEDENESESSDEDYYNPYDEGPNEY